MLDLVLRSSWVGNEALGVFSLVSDEIILEIRPQNNMQLGNQTPTWTLRGPKCTTAHSSNGSSSSRLTSCLHEPFLALFTFSIDGDSASLME